MNYWRNYALFSRISRLICIFQDGFYLFIARRLFRMQRINPLEYIIYYHYMRCSSFLPHRASSIFVLFILFVLIHARFTQSSMWILNWVKPKISWNNQNNILFWYKQKMIYKILFFFRKRKKNMFFIWKFIPS